MGCHSPLPIKDLLENQIECHLGAGLLLTRLIEWMYYRVPKETLNVCQSTPSSFPPPISSIVKGMFISAAVPWLWMIWVQCSEGCPTPRSLSAAYFSRKLQEGAAFGKHEHRTWCMQCQQRAPYKSIWPKQINLEFYEIEQHTGLVTAQEIGRFWRFLLYSACVFWFEVIFISLIITLFYLL